MLESIQIALREANAWLLGAGSASFLAILYYLIKTLIDHRLRVALSAQAALFERERTELASRLARVEHRQGVAFARLDAKRAKVIDSIYSKVYSGFAAADAVTAILDSGRPLDSNTVTYFCEVSKGLLLDSKELDRRVQRHAIYFDAPTHTLLDNYSFHLRRLGYLAAGLIHEAKTDEHLAEYPRWFELMDGEVRPGYERLRQSFRVQLGMGSIELQASE